MLQAFIVYNDSKTVYFCDQKYSQRITVLREFQLIKIFMTKVFFFIKGAHNASSQLFTQPTTSN